MRIEGNKINTSLKKREYKYWESEIKKYKEYKRRIEEMEKYSNGENSYYFRKHYERIKELCSVIEHVYCLSGNLEKKFIEEYFWSNKDMGEACLKLNITLDIGRKVRLMVIKRILENLGFIED